MGRRVIPRGFGSVTGAGPGGVRVPPSGGLRRCRVPSRPPGGAIAPRIHRRRALPLAAPARRLGNALATSPSPSIPQPLPPFLGSPPEHSRSPSRFSPVSAPRRGGGGGVSSGGEAPTRVCVKAGPEQEDRSGGKGGETGAKPKSRCDRGRAEPFAKAASVTPPLPDPNTRRFLLPLPLISFLFHHPNPRAGGCCAVCGPRCPFRGNSVARNSPRENAVAVSKVDRQVLAWSRAAACDSNIWLA